MRVLVHEQVAGVGLASLPLPASLRREGSAMLPSIVTDPARVHAYPQLRARPKQGPLAPAAFTTFVATMGPSDSLSTRRDFTIGLYPPPLPDVGRRGGSPRSASGYTCVPSSLPRKRPAPLRSSDAVCCLRPDMTGSATSPFGFLSHGAAKFTLSHSARRLAPLARSFTATAGLSTLRSIATFSSGDWSLLRGAPAPTAAGPSPASLMQHLGRTVQARPRSRRTMCRILYAHSRQQDG